MVALLEQSIYIKLITASETWTTQCYQTENAVSLHSLIGISQTPNCQSFVLCKDAKAVMCSDYAGVQPSLVYSTTGSVRHIDVENDILYYLQDDPNRYVIFHKNLNQSLAGVISNV